jgi:hypothetical protein
VDLVNFGLKVSLDKSFLFYVAQILVTATEILLTQLVCFLFSYVMLFILNFNLELFVTSLCHVVYVLLSFLEPVEY